MKLGLPCAVAVLVSSPAFATLPPDRPDYIFKYPEGTWVYGERLWGEFKPCNRNLCEAGFHEGDFVISLDHTYNGVRIVAGFKGCQGASWNLVNLDEVPGADRPAVLRYLTKTMTSYAAEQCKKEAPKVPVPDLSRMFPSKENGN